MITVYYGCRQKKCSNLFGSFLDCNMIHCVCQLFCPALLNNVRSEPKTMALNYSQSQGISDRTGTVRMKAGKGRTKTFLINLAKYCLITCAPDIIIFEKVHRMN